MIVNRVSNSLTVVDVRSGQVADTITEVGDKPSSIALSSDGRRAFVVLIGERAPEDPPQRLSGKDAAVAVIDLAKDPRLRPSGWEAIPTLLVLESSVLTLSCVLENVLRAIPCCQKQHLRSAQRSQ